MGHVDEDPHETQISAVDLFCGAGGLSFGMQRAGVAIAAGIDIDSVCRHPFETNVKAPFLEIDVAELLPSDVASLWYDGAIRVLAGCAPCQPFSTYAQGRTEATNQWQLLRRFADIVNELRPEIVTMENVPRLASHHVFDEFLSTLDSAGYAHNHAVVRCADYGVPQTRSRLVLLASRLGPIELTPPTRTQGRFVTVRDTIGDLAGIRAGEIDSSDQLHRSSQLSETNLQRIRSSKPGGTWRDWDDTLRATCHLKNSGRTYPSVYGRMEWDRPAPTITTQFHGFGNGRFGHPEQDRAISLREGALLQTFPADYSFVPEGGTVSIGAIARLVGNAVPVGLGEAVGKSILQHVRDAP